MVDLQLGGSGVGAWVGRVWVGLVGCWWGWGAGGQGQDGAGWDEAVVGWELVWCGMAW